MLQRLALWQAFLIYAFAVRIESGASACLKQQATDVTVYSRAERNGNAAEGSTSDQRLPHRIAGFYFRASGSSSKC